MTADSSDQMLHKSFKRMNLQSKDLVIGRSNDQRKTVDRKDQLTVVITGP